MSKRLIPFRFTPAGWRLRGVEHDEAELRYNYEGEDLERRLVGLHYSRDPREHTRQLLAIDLKFNKITSYQYDVRMLDLNNQGADELAALEVEFRYQRVSAYEYDRKKVKLTVKKGPSLDLALLGVDLKHGRISDYEHAKQAIEMTKEGREKDEDLLTLEKRCGHISDYAYAKAMIELDDPGVTREVKLLELDRAHGKLEQHEFDKKVATAKGDPWVGVIDDGFDISQGTNGLYFELDWNDQWIDYLKFEGYSGPSDDAIIEQWFEDTCRSYAAERSGSDDFDAGRVRTNRTDRGNGRADYT